MMPFLILNNDTSFVVRITSWSTLVCGCGNALRIRAYGFDFDFGRFFGHSGKHFLCGDAVAGREAERL